MASKRFSKNKSEVSDQRALSSTSADYARYRKGSFAVGRKTFPAWLLARGESSDKDASGGIYPRKCIIIPHELVQEKE